MKYNTLKYSLKVWLTSVVVSPALFIMVLSLIGKMDISEMFREGTRGFNFYFFLVAFSFTFSLATWLTFLLTIVLVRIFCVWERRQKWLIFFSGVLLTMGSFLFVLGPYEIFHDEFGILMYANCAGIGWAVWYYKLDIKVKGSQNPQIAENDEQETNFN